MGKASVKARISDSGLRSFDAGSDVPNKPRVLHIVSQSKS
jgi:hypothetical protein